MKTKDQLIKEVSHQVSDYIEWTVAMEVSQNAHYKTVVESFKVTLENIEKELIDEINELKEDGFFQTKLITETRLIEIRYVMSQLNSLLGDVI